jgi:hypothetical protein
MQKRFPKFGFRKIRSGLFPKPLDKGIFSVFGIFIDDYLRNLTFWEKLKKQIQTQRTKIKQESFDFISKDKNLFIIC